MPEWLMGVIGMLATAAGTYAGIRADLARLHERISHLATDTERAHTRLDSLLIDRR